MLTPASIASKESETCCKFTDITYSVETLNISSSLCEQLHVPLYSIKAAQEDMSSDDEKDDDLFKVKVKTAAEKVILRSR